MIRSVLGLLFILILQTTTFGQQTIFDSLELKLKGSSSDLERVDLLNELSNRYLAYQPQQSKALAEEALAIAKTIGYKRGEAVALNRIGEYEFRQSNYARAVEFTTESLRLAEQLKDSSIMAMAYRVLGNTNTFGFKRFGQALQYQQKAFDIYKKLKDKRNIASFCGNITWIYGQLAKTWRRAMRWLTGEYIFPIR